MFFRPTHAIARFISPSHRFQFTETRHFRSSVSSLWNSPQRIDNFGTLLIESFRSRDLAPQGDRRHWLVKDCISEFEFATEQELFNYYIKTLADVVGSEEEAKKKIYLVSCACPFGFGAEIDEDAARKFGELAYEDFYYDARIKNPSVRSTAQFTPFNWNHRLDNVFSYHLLSKRNPEWNSDHWLIIIKERDGGFGNEILGHFVKMAAEVVGSEEAMKRTYFIWASLPYGFGIEIDEETVNKFKDLPDVLNVLPDYAFDVKDEIGQALLRCVPRGSRFIYYQPSEEYNSEEWACGTEEQASAVAPTHSPVKFDPYECHKRFDGKHWFIATEKLGTEFSSMQQRIDFYIQTLAIVMGSEEEAKEKIYRVECGSQYLGFGAEIEEETSNKLKGMPGVLVVLPDYLFINWHRDNSDEQSFRAFLGELATDLTEWKVGHAPQQTHSMK